MGSALGGGAADQVFGGGSAAVLTKWTVWGVLGFFTVAFALYLINQSNADTQPDAKPATVAPQAPPMKPDANATTEKPPLEIPPAGPSPSSPAPSPKQKLPAPEEKTPVPKPDANATEPAKPGSEGGK